MAEIALRQYESEIDHLIEEARYVEAVAHTRHILNQRPRYINAYYLLGKTMLEADQPELAVDMFHRALNADPEHLMARIGLALAHQRLNNLDAAIWNLERAVELNPGNPDLLDELRQLYGRRDGTEPERIPLNRAALARLYMRGNRASRAVEELRALLTAQPARHDLRLALAEAYWRDDQIVQAADTCQRLLDDMRYCLKANLLLGALWVDSGQEEGQLYLKRAQELDPENTLAYEMFGAASPLKPQEVKVERLAYQPGIPGIDTQAEWFKKLEQMSVTGVISELMPEMTGTEARLVDITAGLEAQIEIPDWLRELEIGGREEAGGALPWMAEGGAETPAPEEATPEGMPEWLRGREAAPAVAAEAEAMPDWLGALAPEEPGPAVEEVPLEAETLPEWLGELTPETPMPETGLDWLTALEPTGAAAVEEVPLPEEGLPDWLRELKKPGAPAEPEAAPAVELPDWLQELQPTAPVAATPVPEAAPEEELPEWLRTPATTEETAAPLLAEAGELPDWLTAFQVETEAVETGEAPAAPAGEAALPDWLAELTAAEAPERAAEIPAAEELPDWLSELQPAGGTVQESEPLEAELLEWLTEIETGEPETEAPAEEVPSEWPAFGAAAAETSAVVEEAPAAEGFFGWEAFGTEAAEVAAPAAEAAVAAEEELLEWERLAEQVEAGGIEAPTAEGDFLSGEEALAWLESLTAGKEDELRAQAEAEAQARVAEILGRKPEPTPEPQVVETEAMIEEAPTAAEPFGWETFGAETTEIETPAAEAGVEEELLEWERLAEQVEAGGVEEAPIAEGDFLSGDAALAWLESLATGKEEELRAQAEAEAQARVAEILGRKAEPTPEPQGAAFEAATVEAVEEVPTTEGFFGWETFGAEATEIKAPVMEATVEAELPQWERLAEQVEAGIVEAPVPEGGFLSGDEALAWLEKLAAGKEEELRAQAEAEAQARVAEILGRKPEPKRARPVSPIEKPAPVVAETPVPAEAALPAAEGDFLSGDAALAWLESLAAGKEEQLRAQAEAEAQARVAEILGRTPRPAPAPEAVTPAPTAPAPTPPVEKAVAEEVAPVAEGEFLSGDEALAWLEKLAAGKEAELRARAEAEAQARVAEILGRKPTPTPEVVTPEPTVPAPAPMAEEIVVEEAVTEEVTPAAEGEFLSGDEALAWLEKLAAGKEEELRARAEAEAQARVAEILGRKAAPAPEGVTPEPTVPAPTPVAEEIVEEAVTEEVIPVAEGEFLSGDEALAWLEKLAAGKEEELRAQAEAEAQARVAEILGRKPAPEAAAVETPKPEAIPPKAPTVEAVVKAPAPQAVAEVPAPKAAVEAPAPKAAPKAPAPEAVVTAPPVAAVAAGLDLAALRDAVARDESDYASRLSLARALWRTGATEEALTHYAYLIQAQAHLQDIIADLQQATAARPQDALLLQALGDAYMAEGLVDQALKIYEQAMAML